MVSLLQPSLGACVCVCLSLSLSSRERKAAFLLQGKPKVARQLGSVPLHFILALSPSRDYTRARQEQEATSNIKREETTDSCGDHLGLGMVAIRTNNTMFSSTSVPIGR